MNDRVIHPHVYLDRKLTDIKNHYYSVLRKAIRLIKSWRFQQDPHSKYSSQVASYHIQPNFYLIHLSNLVDALMLLATEVGLANQHLAYYNELLLEILR